MCISIRLSSEYTVFKHHSERLANIWQNIFFQRSTRNSKFPNSNVFVSYILCACPLKFEQLFWLLLIISRNFFVQLFNCDNWLIVKLNCKNSFINLHVFFYNKPWIILSKGLCGAGDMSGPSRKCQGKFPSSLMRLIRVNCVVKTTPLRTQSFEYALVMTWWCLWRGRLHRA